MTAAVAWCALSAALAGIPSAREYVSADALWSAAAVALEVSPWR